MAKTTTKGLEAMRRKMAAIPRSVRAAMETSLAQSAEELVAMQKRLAPVDSGDLRDSIRWVRGVFSGGRGGSVDRDNLAATVFTSDFKAPLVEFGTQAGAAGARVGNIGANNKQSISGRKSYRTHSGTPAQPFFFPAYRSLKRRIKSRISRAVNKAIKAGAK